MYCLFSLIRKFYSYFFALYVILKLSTKIISAKRSIQIDRFDHLDAALFPRIEPVSIFNTGDVLSPLDNPGGGLPQLRPLHAGRDPRDQQHPQVPVPADHQEGP